MKYSSLHFSILSVLFLVCVAMTDSVSAEENPCAQAEIAACFAREIEALSDEDRSLIKNTFERLSDEQKKSVHEIFSTGTSAKDALAAVTSKNVPIGLHEEIMQEISLSEADPDLEIPGLEEALVTLGQTGEIEDLNLEAIQEYAPISSQSLPIVIVSMKLKDAQGRLVDAQGRLVDAQGRLVDAQGRLVDAQEELQDLKEISEQQDKILGESSGN